MFTSKTVVYLFITVILLLAGCSKSDDQRRFENEAHSIPDGITEMGTDGERTENGEIDPDDWKISPVYSGQLEVDTPAFPNPVPLNSNLQIHISINFSPDNLSRIEVFAFKQPDQQPTHIGNFEHQGLTIGLIDINLNAQSIIGSSDTGHSPSDKYRILIYDDNQRNLITYGDVQIE